MHAIRDKIVLRTFKCKSFPALFPFLLLRANTESRHEASLVQILEASSNDDRRIIIRATSLLLSGTDTAQDQRVMQLWLRLLRACSFMQGPHHDNPHWITMYQQLARRLGKCHLA